MPSTEAGMSVTLKRRESERYAGDGSWLVFHGTPNEIQKAIWEAFGFDPNGDETLAETVLRAEREYRSQDSSKPRSLGAQKSAVDTVKDALDGEVISVEKTDPPFDPDPKKTDDVWADSPAEDNNAGLGAGKDPLIEKIEAAGSKQELKVLWSQNQKAFEREEIKSAAAARAKAL